MNSDNSKKYILNLTGTLREELQILFDSLGFEITHVDIASEELGQEATSGLALVLINSEDQLDTLIEKELLSTPMISFGEIRNRKKFFENGGVAVFNSDVMTNPVISKILENFLGADSSLQIELAYNNLLAEANSVKVMTPANIGYYSDIFANDATINQFNTSAIRNYFGAISAYLIFLHQKGIGEFPLEVDYGLNENSFLLQVHTTVTSFFDQNLWESLNKEKGNNPFGNLLDISITQCDLLNINYIQNSNKLVFTALWDKKENEAPFSSILMGDVPRYRYNLEKGFDIRTKVDIKVEKGLEELPIPGEGPTVLAANNEAVSFENLNNIIQLKLMIEFIINLRNSEKPLKPAEELELSDISSYLLYFSNQEAVAELGEDERYTILSCIKDGELFSALKEFIGENLDDEPSEDYLQGILDNLNSLTVAQTKTIVGGETIVGDEKTLVKGTVEEGDDFSRVKGAGEKEEESITLINGSGDDLQDSDVWNVKKSQIEEKVKGQWNNLIQSSGSNEELQKELVQTISGELELDEDQTQMIVTNLADKADDEELKNKMAAFKAQEVKDRLSIDKKDQDLSHRDDQIKKMKSLIDRMKTEIFTMKQAENLAQSLPKPDAENKPAISGTNEEVFKELEEQNEKLKDELNQYKQPVEAQESTVDLSKIDDPEITRQIQGLQNSLDKSNSDLKVKDKIIEKAADDSKRALENKDRLFDSVASELERYKDQASETNLAADDDEAEVDYDKFSDPEVRREIQGLANDLKKVNTQLRGKDKNLERVIDNNKRLMDKSEKKIEDLETEMIRYRDELDAYKQAPVEKVEEIDVSKIEDHEAKRTIQGLQNDLSKVNNTLKAKETALDRLNDSNKRSNEQKDRRIKLLSDETFELKKDMLNVAGSDAVPYEDFRKIEGEKQALENQLATATARISSISEKVDNTKAVDGDKLNTQIQKLTEKNQLALTTMQKFKEEKEKVDARMRNVQKELDGKDNDIQQLLQKCGELEGSSNNVDVKEIEHQLDEIKVKLRTTEDSLKKETLKAKQFEQKIKYLNATIDKNSKDKLIQQGQGKKAGGGDPALAHKMKQLEMMNSKMTQANKKNMEDLAEKKKEAVKFKTECVALKNKTQALERKLAKLASASGKKAA